MTTVENEEKIRNDTETLDIYTVDLENFSLFFFLHHMFGTVFVVVDNIRTYDIQQTRTRNNEMRQICRWNNFDAYTQLDTSLMGKYRFSLAHLQENVAGRVTRK